MVTVMYIMGDRAVVLEVRIVVEECVLVWVVVVTCDNTAGPPGSDMLVDPAGTMKVRVTILRVASSDADGN